MSAEHFELYTKNYDVEIVEYKPGRLSEVIVIKDEDDDLCEGANACDVGLNPNNDSYIFAPQDGKQPPATPQHPLTTSVVYIKMENNSQMTEDNNCMSEVNVSTIEDNDFMNERQEEGNPTQANPDETTREVHPSANVCDVGLNPSNASYLSTPQDGEQHPATPQHPLTTPVVCLKMENNSHMTEDNDCMSQFNVSTSEDNDFRNEGQEEDNPTQTNPDETTREVHPKKVYRKRGRQRHCTDKQLLALNKMYEQTMHPDAASKKDLAVRIGLPYHYVDRWFVHKRFRENSKTRAELSKVATSERVLRHMVPGPGANVCDVGLNPSNASYLSTPQDGKQHPATPQHPLTTPVVCLKMENNSHMTEDNDSMSQVNVSTSEDNDLMNEGQEEGNSTQAYPDETTRGMHPKKVDHTRDQRIRCTDKQLVALNKMYEQTKYPDAASKYNLALRIGLPYRYVLRWFCEKRFKENLKTRAELSKVANVETSEQVLRRVVPEKVYRKRGRKRGCTDKQLLALNKMYEQTMHPDAASKNDLAVRIGLPNHYVHKWFIEKRYRENLRTKGEISKVANVETSEQVLRRVVPVAVRDNGSISTDNAESHRLSKNDRLILEKAFKQNRYKCPDPFAIEELSAELGLSIIQVKRWFKYNVKKANNIKQIPKTSMRKPKAGQGGKRYRKGSLLKRRIVKQRKRPRDGQELLPLSSRQGAHCHICNRSDERITEGRCNDCNEFIGKYLRWNKTRRSEVLPPCSHKGTQVLAGCKACLVFRYKQATLKKRKASQLRKKENQLSTKVQHCPSRSTRLSSRHQNNSCEEDSSGYKISEHLTASLSEKIDVTETSSFHRLRSSSRHHNNSCEGEKSDEQENSGSTIFESEAAFISEKIPVEPQKKIDVTEKSSNHRLRSSSRHHYNSHEGEKSDEKGDSDTRDSEAATAPQEKITVEFRKKIDVTENLNKLRKIATTFFYSDLMDTKNRSKLFTEMIDCVNDIWAHVFDLNSTTRVEETEKGDFDTRDSDAATVPQKKIDVIENLNKLRKIATTVCNSDHMDTKNRSILVNEINDCVNDIWAHIFNFKSTTRGEESAPSTEKSVCGKLLSPCSCSCKTHGNSLEMKIQSLEGIVMESGTRIRDLEGRAQKSRSEASTQTEAYLVFTNQSNERDKPPSCPNELPYRNDAEFTPIIQPLTRYQNSPSILTSYCQICDQSRSFATVNQLSICQLCINFMETRKILSHSNQSLLVPRCSHRGTQAKFGCEDCLVFRFNKVHAGLMPNVTSFGLEGSHLLGSQFYNNGHNISSNNPARLNLETFQSSGSISNHSILNSPSSHTPPGQPPPDLSQGSNNQLMSSNLTSFSHLPRRGISPEVNPYQRVPGDVIQ